MTPSERLLLRRLTRSPALPIVSDLDPADRVPCRMRAMLLVRTCLVIRSRVWPTGKRAGVPVTPACVGCPLGEAYAARSPWFEPPPQRARTTLLPTPQRLARDRWLRTFPAWPGT